MNAILKMTSTDLKISISAKTTIFGESESVKIIIINPRRVKSDPHVEGSN